MHCQLGSGTRSNSDSGGCGSSSAAAAAAAAAATGAAPAYYQCDSCVICMCDFEDGERVTVLPCGHNFHIEVFHVEHPPPLPQLTRSYLERKRTISSETSAGFTPLIRLA